MAEAKCFLIESCDRRWDESELEAISLCLTCMFVTYVFLKGHIVIIIMIIIPIIVIIIYIIIINIMIITMILIKSLILWSNALQSEPVLFLNKGTIRGFIVER